MMLAYSSLCSVSIVGTFPEVDVDAPPVIISTTTPVLVAEVDVVNIVATVISGPIKADVSVGYLNACACCDDAVPILTIDLGGCVGAEVAMQAHRMIATVRTE